MAGGVEIERFLAGSAPIVDVRSPGEFAKGHMPGAISLPLFDDDERAQVGTCYKQRGREAAIELGFDLLGPRLGDLTRRAKAIAPDRYLRVHCWRGGMRSAGVAWLLRTAGFQTTTLEGGYKAFRRWARRVFDAPRSIIVLGGMTGTGKTQALHALRECGAQVLDLEGLAHHRGSSFGSLGLPAQPSNEQFENRIADRLAGFDPAQPVWIEAESRRVGSCCVPEELFRRMNAVPTIEIVRSLDERLTILMDAYGQTDREALVQATERIRKRLGGVRTQRAIELFRENRLDQACAVLLDYYDRTYRYDLKHRRQTPLRLDVTGLSPAATARVLIDQAPALQSA